MQNSLGWAAVALALTFGIHVAALADDAPCREDAARLCADAQGARARIQCLAGKRDELSEACRARVDQAREGAGQGRGGRLEACRADLEKLCAGIEPGGGALRRCLLEHRDALSEACRAQLAPAR
jgi:hypothetical protein